MKDPGGCRGNQCSRWIEVQMLKKAMVVCAVLPTMVVAPQAQAEPESPAVRYGCDHSHGYKAAAKGLRKALRHHQPLTQRQGRRAWHFILCVRKPWHADALRARRLHWKEWRSAYANVWRIRLNGMDPSWVQWARNITACESGWNRYASNGSHFSYFQWASPTWAAASAGFDAPASPYDASWEHQAVIAIHWAWTAGTSQWVCKG